MTEGNEVAWGPLPLMEKRASPGLTPNGYSRVTLVLVAPLLWVGGQAGWVALSSGVRRADQQWLSSLCLGGRLHCGCVVSLPCSGVRRASRNFVLVVAV